MTELFDVCLGEKAPPYIVIAISLTLSISILGIIAQYKQHRVDIYEARFSGIKLAYYIRFFAFCSFLLLSISLINIFIVDDNSSFFKYLLQFYIKSFLFITSYAIFFGIFEYFVKYKEHLQVDI